MYVTLISKASCNDMPSTYSQVNQEKPVETVEKAPKTQSLSSVPQEIPLPPAGVNLSSIPVPTKPGEVYHTGVRMKVQDC